MARDKALWATIRADFLATGTSYPELAAKYGVSISTLKKTAAREHWALDKDMIDVQAAEAPREEQEPQEEPEPPKKEPEEPEPEPTTVLAAVPTDTEIMEAKRERLEKFFEITDGMMDRILAAINSPDVITPYALKLLSSALRDLREMQGLNRTALDEEEQRARIAKLRSELNVPEANENDVRVVFVSTDGAEE